MLFGISFKNYLCSLQYLSKIKVRLLRLESFSEIFNQLTKRSKTDKKVRLHKEFLKLIRNKKKHNTDIDIGQQGGQQYFLKFLNEYKIVPETN